jgi:hypothetical protein
VSIYTADVPGDYVAALRAHYLTRWGVVPVMRTPSAELAHQLPPAFHVLAHPPSNRRPMWRFATCGMSDPSMKEPVELTLLSGADDPALVDLLAAVALHHRRPAPLTVGGAVPFGRPWQPGSACDHGLVSLPYPDGPEFESLKFGKIRIRCLWLVPVTAAEVAFKEASGLEALELAFEKAGLDYLNPARASTV